MEHCSNQIWNGRIKETKRLRKPEIGRGRNAAVNTSGANLHQFFSLDEQKGQKLEQGR